MDYSCKKKQVVWLQPRSGSSLLLGLVESSPELYERIVQYLHVVELRSLSASCQLLRRATRENALAADTQVQTQWDYYTQGCSLPASVVGDLLRRRLPTML